MYRSKKQICYTTTSCEIRGNNWRRRIPRRVNLDQVEEESTLAIRGISESQKINVDMDPYPNIIIQIIKSNKILNSNSKSRPKLSRFGRETDTP